MKVMKLKKLAYIFITIILLLSQICFVYAANVNELKDKQNDLQEKIDQTNTELQGVKSKMSSTMKQIQNMMSEVNVYKDEFAGKI